MSTGLQLAVPAAVDDSGTVHRAAGLPAPNLGGVLYCAGCHTVLDDVAAHTRTIGGHQVQVRRHFRLAPGHTHDLRCPFDFPQATARIARAAPAVMRAVPGGYAVKIPEAPARSFTRAPREWRPGRAGNAATFHAAEAVATIGRLAALLRRFGGQHAAPGVFTAAAGRHAIDWPAFCFDPTSGVELVERLHAGGSTWPLAVLFVADRAGQSKAGTSWWVGQTTDAHADLGGERVGIRITVRSRTPDPIRALDLGGYTIAFGDWQLYRPENPSLSGRRGARVVEAVCWINQAWQVQAAP